MNSMLTVWGIIMLIVFVGAHYATQMNYITAQWMWVVIGIIFLVLSIAMGKGMKNAPQGSKETWMSLVIFGFITTLVVAFEVVPVDLTWLMSLWFLLMGAGIFADGHAGGQMGYMHVASGLVFIIASLFVPGFGSAWVFMAGALFFGLMGLINGLLAPKMGGMEKEKGKK